MNHARFSPVTYPVNLGFWSSNTTFDLDIESVELSEDMISISPNVALHESQISFSAQINDEIYESSWISDIDGVLNEDTLVFELNDLSRGNHEITFKYKLSSNSDWIEMKEPLVVFDVIDIISPNDGGEIVFPVEFSWEYFGDNSIYDLYLSESCGLF